MGHCHYHYNPTELYQRTAPGTAPESCCGAVTYAAQDEPELLATTDYIDGQPVNRMSPTGRLLGRSQDDPYCPAHGGSPEPAAPVITWAEIQQRRDELMALAAEFDRQNPAVDAAEDPAAPAIEAAGPDLAAVPDAEQLEPEHAEENA